MTDDYLWDELSDAGEEGVYTFSDTADTQQETRTETQEAPEIQPEIPENVAPTPRHSKRVILSDKKWRRYKDLLNVVLEDNMRYTDNEVQNIINEFMWRS